jgi:hypothetical protein
MVITEAALCDGSAWLVARRVMGFVVGTDVGATKSTMAAEGAVGGTHGFEAVTQTAPTVLLPFGMPLTAHVTAVSVLPVTFAENELRCARESVADGGETLTLTWLVTVTILDAVAAPAEA